MRLEDIKRGSQITGILPDGIVTVVDVVPRGANMVEVTYKDVRGRVENELVMRDDEARLDVAQVGQAWAFDGDGAMFRLVSEAYRIRLAHLFDPLLAVHSSQVDPLPHQITAVYGDMLPRQPLRFLLADDVGAGKTIMTGLYLKELLMRGDLRRCLIVSPGSLGEQWQDELYRRFDLNFDILSRESIESARSGNPFNEHDLLICRLDMLARDEELQEKLTAANEWDVIAVDEAHKMSASTYSGEMKATKRYRLGQTLGNITRNLLLLTATPHNGKEEEFQAFMALLDADRFEGKADKAKTQGAVAGTPPKNDVSDLMTRRVKEELVRFDGTRLFPERRAYSVNYELSSDEADLYEQVTSYVRKEMGKAEDIAKAGEKRRGNTVGFALTILQRRLASSPEAIYQSLTRRRWRLQDRLQKERAAKQSGDAQLSAGTSSASGAAAGGPALPPKLRKAISEWDGDDADDYYDETPSGDIEDVEEAIVDSATAARTIAELETEIQALIRLEEIAFRVRASNADRKWDELSKLMQGDDGLPSATELFDADGHRRKIIIFTEHRDTLNYLEGKIATLLGRPEAIVTIHGGVPRETRRNIQLAFTQDKAVSVLIATDAAGEGINLQRAHLMVNYDLPWNPNRIEQRFGRIHRIGQTEVCHLWNLVAKTTREGEVWDRLFQKLAVQREALNDGVFDVLGQCFDQASLRELMIEAVRYGDQPDVKARLFETVESALDRDHLTKLLEERALARETMTAADVEAIRENMERAEARKLQPHFIMEFFHEALGRVGGTIRKREKGRWEITHVPSAVRQRDRQLGKGARVLHRYDRITFEKQDINIPGKPTAEFLSPGHPLLDATLELFLEQYSDLMRRGTILVDPESRTDQIRALFLLEHSIQDGVQDKEGNRRVISRRLQFVEVNADGAMVDAGYAPYLDYRPALDVEKDAVTSTLDAQWLSRNLENEVTDYAAENLVPEHLGEVRRQREALIEKTRTAVHERLTKEIFYWNRRSRDLKTQEEAGKVNANLNSQQAARRADELEVRLRARTETLDREKKISARAPFVLGGALVIPQSLLIELGVQPRDHAAQRGGASSNNKGKDGASVNSATSSGSDLPEIDSVLRRQIDDLAMATVLEHERSLGHNPHAMPHENPGYDVESKDGKSGSLRFLEVKGKLNGSDIVTISKTQILTALNKPDDWYLVIVHIDYEGTVLTAREPIYLQRSFTHEPDFAATSINFDIEKLIAASAPAADSQRLGRTD